MYDENFLPVTEVKLTNFKARKWEAMVYFCQEAVCAFRLMRLGMIGMRKLRR